MQKNETTTNLNQTQIKFKMDKDLNISSDTIKVLEENTVRKISDISHSHIFTDMSPRANDIKKRKKTSRTS